MKRMEVELIILDIIHKMQRKQITLDEYQDRLVALQQEAELTFEEMSPIVTGFIIKDKKRKNLEELQERNTRIHNPEYYQKNPERGGYGIRKGIYDSFTY